MANRYDDLIKKYGGRVLSSLSVVYVRAGLQTSIGRIGPGEYRLRFMLGTGWSGDRFCANESFSEFTNIVKFDEYDTATSQHYEEMSVTLNAVRNGNARTRKIEPFRMP